MILNQDRRNNVSSVTSCNEVTVPPSQPSKSTKETLGKGSQESSASINKTNENGVKMVHPQLTKRQRKKPAQHDQDFLWIT
jgi:hypothetical protein